MFKDYKGAIFDMDGTLLESMDAWRKLGREYCLRHNLSIPRQMEEEKYITCFDSCKAIVETHDVGMTAEELFKRVLEYLTEHYVSDVVCKDGALEWVKTLSDNGVKICVATATPTHIAVPALIHHGFFDYLEFVVGGDDLALRKSDPKYLEKVCSMLGLRPEECMVYEDTFHVIKAAKSIGCGVCAIEDDYSLPYKDDIISISDMYISSFNQLSFSE